MTKKMTNILVGCGGSGAKIATELAKLMSQDPHWRYEMDQNVFFMLMDTNEGDLNNYGDQLRNSAPDVHVSTILMTAGFNTVTEILAKFADGLISDSESNERKAMERFAEHWWCENPGAESWESANPFEARSVRQIKTGAAQVPLVSHLAAWHAMRDSDVTPNSIESTFTKLCDVIAARRSIIDHGGGNPLGTFNVFFLGSVAGGTGRGCMIPVAFKFKEVFFNRFNEMPFISGYFLDESCFKERRKAHEVAPQRMNAMTGWSELSTWISLYQRKSDQSEKGSEAGNYRYSLPGIERAFDESYDVLRSPSQAEGGRREKVTAGLVGTRASLPFDAVGVIGNTSAAGFALNDRDTIYKMVASGLYCRLTRSEIDGALSNEHRTYFSIGSAVAEIQAHDIQSYYADLARYDVARRLMRDSAENEARTQAERILDMLGLASPLQVLLAEPDDGELQNVLQLLLRNWFSGGGEAARDLDTLRLTLDEQIVSHVQDVLDEILKESRLEDPRFLENIGREFVSAFQHFSGGEHGDGNSDSIANVVENLLIATEPSFNSKKVASVLDQTGSAAVVAETAALLGRILEGLQESDLSEKAIDHWFSDSRGPNKPNAFATLEHIKGREGPLGLTGKYFSDQEISQMMAEARRHLQVNYARALGNWLCSVGNDATVPGLLSRLRPRLDRIQKNARMIVACSNRYLQESGMTATRLQDRASKLFVGEELIDSLAMSDLNSTNFYVRRTIRPAQPSQEELQLINSRALETTRDALMGDPLEGSPEDHRGLLDQLSDSLRASKYLYKDQLDGEEIISRFELSFVLQDLEKKWRSYLEKVKNQGLDSFEEVAQKFENFFGIKPKITGDGVSISPDKSIGGKDPLLLGMACAMARSCRPFWKTTGSSGRQPKLLVQIPIGQAEEKKPEWEKEIQKQANIQGASDGAVDIIANPTDVAPEHRHNPFIVVIYIDEGASTLDEVESLGTWRNDSAVHKALQRAEDLNKPPMPFATESEMWPNYAGSGFADPCYVFNPLLRKHRWRPWVPMEEQKKESASTSELDLAVVYACWGPGWFLEAAFGEGDAAGILEASNLPSEPIFQEGNRKKFSYARHPYVIEPSGTASMNTGRMLFVPGNAIVSSIRNIGDVLKGAKTPLSKARESESDIGALRVAVETEYQDFFEKLASVHGFHPTTGKAVYAKLLNAMKVRAIDERDHNPDDGEFWQRVLEAIDVKRKQHDL